MNNYHFKIGIPTMLMLLLSLCLVIFSILALSTSYSDYKLTKKMVDRNFAYYEACNQAYESLYKLKITNNTGENEFYFPTSATEGLYIRVSNDDSIKILNWQLLNTGNNDYDEHLNVLP